MGVEHARGAACLACADACSRCLAAWRVGGRPLGRLRRTVAVEQRGVGAVQGQPLAVRHKHGHLHAVLASRKDLSNEKGREYVSVLETERKGSTS